MDDIHTQQEVEDHRPKGNFRCCVCGQIWDGSKLILDPQALTWHWTCGDVFCGANVKRISE